MMSLAEKIAFILGGKAEFARGGGGRKGGGKSSKKAKGVTQGSKGGACCKTEGGKFATGNNYGSLNKSSGKVAANKARATADKATRQANVRVEATRRGAGPAAMIAARSSRANVTRASTCGAASSRMNASSRVAALTTRPFAANQRASAIDPRSSRPMAASTSARVLRS